MEEAKGNQAQCHCQRIQYRKKNDQEWQEEEKNPLVITENFK